MMWCDVFRARRCDCWITTVQKTRMIDESSFCCILWTVIFFHFSFDQLHLHFQDKDRLCAVFVAIFRWSMSSRFSFKHETTMVDLMPLHRRQSSGWLWFGWLHVAFYGTPASWISELWTSNTSLCVRNDLCKFNSVWCWRQRRQSGWRRKCHGVSGDVPPVNIKHLLTPVRILHEQSPLNATSLCSCAHFAIHKH